MSVVTSGTRPVSPERYAGKAIYESDTQRTLIYDGTGWIIMAEPLQSYAAATSGVTLGTGGTCTGYYTRSNGFCELELILFLGAGGALTADPVITLPVAIGGWAMGLEKATVLYFDNSANTRCYGSSRVATSTTIGFVRWDTTGNTATGAALGASQPFTWAASDQIQLFAKYQMTTRYS